MIIRNYRELAQSRPKRNALKILEAGLQAASPEIGIGRALAGGSVEAGGRRIDLSGHSGIHLVAFGKSADRMAAAASSILDVKSGIVVVPRGSRPAVRGKKFQVLFSAHPIPDQSSIAAAKAITKFLRRRKGSEFVLFLVSGGGSSLLCLPDGIELADKTYATDLLLRSGATIQEFNCVRKHLSRIKGGRMAEGLPCDAAALVMSDVVGDDPSSIASGATYCDTSTFGDALSIIKKYGLAGRFPKEALGRIREGAAGNIPETPKSPAMPNVIIARNGDCTAAMGLKASELGYSTGMIRVSGDVEDAARHIIGSMTQREGSCVIFGGEPTVRVAGSGSGGRNQELVLRVLRHLQGGDNSHIISSVGTDGIDGNTEFAGALTENIRVERTIIDSYLARNDSGSFFARYGGQVSTGYTHTNLMDIGVVLPG